MQKHFKNPLSGRPRTVETKGRDGKPQFRIVARELTPFRARMADGISTALTVVLLIGCILAFFNAAKAGLSEAVMLAGVFLVGERVLRATLRAALRGRCEIVMTTDTIKVRGWFVWRSYNRLLEHRFALHVHDHAEEENRDLDYAARQASSKGHVIRQTPYYMASFHVVLVYAGQRADLLTVYGQKEAAAIVARLQYCDRLLNEAIAMSGGISKRPEDDWTAAPGGIDRG